MQIIEKLISEGVIPYDVGTQLKESFDAKVEGRVAEITEAFKADLKEKNEKATAAFMNLMKESFEKKAQEHKLMLESKLCDYMDLVVENFVQENKEALETKMNESKVEALLEGFQSMMIASGVELKHIQEELEADKSAQDELQESKTKEFDALAEEVIELRKEIDVRKKADLFLKLTEGLSDLQKEKLQEQAEKIADDISLEEFDERMTIMKEAMLEVSQATDDSKFIVESFNKKTGIFDKKDASALLFGSSIFK